MNYLAGFSRILTALISENPEEYKKIWIDGGTHGREWITTATVTYILNEITRNWEEQPEYIRNKTWYFMPVINPDGYVYSRRTDRLWRKTRVVTKRPACRGVDLNRNYNVGWNTTDASPNPCSLKYQGKSPLSEQETKAIDNFLQTRKSNLEAFLTFHSYSQNIVYPYAYKSEKCEHADTLERIAAKASNIIERKSGRFYDYGSRYKTLNPAGGGADDYAYVSLGAKYVYTIELRDTGRYGFILPPNQIRGTGFEGVTLVYLVAKDIA